MLRVCILMVAKGDFEKEELAKIAGSRVDSFVLVRRGESVDLFVWYSDEQE